MSRKGVSGWMFLLVPAHQGRPGQRAVELLCVCVVAILRPHRYAYHRMHPVLQTWNYLSDPDPPHRKGEMAIVVRSHA